MATNTRTLVTIITETPLEHIIVREVEQLGAKGYTLTNARGKGSTGLRDGEWDANSNIRLEVVCTAEVAKAIIERMKVKYYDNYAMILFWQDVSVIRPEKF